MSLHLTPLNSLTTSTSHAELGVLSFYDQKSGCATMRLTQTSLILHGKNRYNSRSENRWITPIKSRQLGLYKVVPTRLPLWQELNPLLMLNNQQTPWSDCQAHASVDTLRQTTDAAKQLRCGRALSRVAKKVAGAQEVSAWKLQFPGYDVFRGEH